MVVPQIAVNKIRVRNSSAGEPPSDFELPLTAQRARKTSGECAQDWQQANGVMSRTIGSGRFESLAIEDAREARAAPAIFAAALPRGNEFSTAR